MRFLIKPPQLWSLESLKMSWSLSRYRAGELVEVRSQEEILATLDASGCVEGMPFMPEMLQYCGQQFRVEGVAHKTCDTVSYTGGRRLRSTVHLAGLRCDGSAHGGCEAECSLFWKDVWLKPCGENAAKSTAPAATAIPYTKDQLHANTRALKEAPGEEPRYVCQATKLVEATEPLAWWDVRQYLFDIVTRNRSLKCVLRTLALASLRRLVVRAPLGYRVLESLYTSLHRRLTGRANPWVSGKVPAGVPTPTGRLNLQPGELVRIKAKADIEQTIDETCRNRGLSIDKEMASYCGRVAKVRRSVERIVDESTGKMRHMKQPCITLEGVFCNASYSEGRLLCPRAIPPYWREIWLERVNDSAGVTGGQNADKQRDFEMAQ